MRVVSLVPSSTETLLHLGADVVACTRFCEQPTIAHVGGTKNPDIAAIVELAPDLVVLDREENRIEDHDALRAAGLEVFVSDVRTVDDATAVVAELAAATGRPAPDVRTDGPPPSGTTEPDRSTVFVPIWRRPWMSIGRRTYGASLLARLGLDVVAGPATDPDDPYPMVELADVAASSPDLVLVPSEPYEFGDEHLAELASALHVTPRRVDGQDLFWWGSRTDAAIERLAACVSRSY